uniref:Interleukin-1 receptor-like 1 n=1 Tax=Rousettus aegyptiacus TaxID=9407 RepID=A0A7J8FIU2_ROUAE|nr:interleukin 1 receptor like 1 [Rousettus aegyptiacus]
MRLWVLAILSFLSPSTAGNKLSWGLENEALIIRCPGQRKSSYSVDWYYSETDTKITTQKGNRVFASGGHLKLLPAQVNDSGIYTCVTRSPTFNKTGYVNVTIYKKQPGCNISDDLMYSTTFGSEKNSRINCPTISLYNLTAPVEWFKNCKILQGPRYYKQGTYLLIDNATSKDSGDYTCRFTHNENGVNYIVTATRSFTVKDKKGFSSFPVIIAPPQNETQDVEIGKTAYITCSACFGKGSQLLAAVRWWVNDSKVENLSNPRIQEEQEQNQSSSNDLTCQSIVLRIADVREEDLSLKYECLALNSPGWTKRRVTLRKKPSKECSQDPGLTS